MVIFNCGTCGPRAYTADFSLLHIIHLIILYTQNFPNGQAFLTALQNHPYHDLILQFPDKFYNFNRNQRYQIYEIETQIRDLIRRLNLIINDNTFSLTRNDLRILLNEDGAIYSDVNYINSIHFKDNYRNEGLRINLYDFIYKYLGELLGGNINTQRRITLLQYLDMSRSRRLWITELEKNFQGLRYETL